MAITASPADATASAVEPLTRYLYIIANAIASAEAASTATLGRSGTVSLSFTPADAVATATGTLSTSAGATSLSPSPADAVASANEPPTRYYYIIASAPASAEATSTATLERSGVASITLATADATATIEASSLLRRISLLLNPADATASGAASIVRVVSLSLEPANAVSTSTSDIVLRRALMLAVSDAVAYAPPPDLVRRISASAFIADAVATASGSLSVDTGGLEVTPSHADATAGMNEMPTRYRYIIGGTANATAGANTATLGAATAATGLSPLPADATATAGSADLDKVIYADPMNATATMNAATATAFGNVLSLSVADATAVATGTLTRRVLLSLSVASAVATSSASLVAGRPLVPSVASATTTAVGTLTRRISVSLAIASAEAASAAELFEIGTKQLYPLVASSTATSTASLLRRSGSVPLVASATATATAALRFQAKELSFSVARARSYASALTVTSEGGVRFSDVVIMRSARLALARLHRGRSRLGPPRISKPLSPWVMHASADSTATATIIEGAHVLTVSSANATSVAGLLQLDKSGEGRVLALSRANSTAIAVPLQLDKTGETRVIGAARANATAGSSALTLTRSGEKVTVTFSRANATSTATGTLSPSTTVFNVLDYGAHRDGVTNDSDHIQAAYNAARSHAASGSHATVYFPAGTYYVSSNVTIGTIRTNDWYGQTTPTVQQAGTILFSGYGATIKYANTTSRYSWLRMAAWPTVQYTTYGNLHVEGFTIDNNYKVPSGVCGYICWFTGNANYDNFVFRDITTTDHITPRTAAATPAARVSGIVIHGDSVSDSQAHYGYCTNITIEDCIIHAGAKSASILSENYGTYTATKYLFDEVNIIGGYYDNHEFYGSNIHLVQCGRGGRVSVVGADCRDCADDGIEVNNCDYTLIEDCHFEGNRQAICLTWFSYPLGVTTPPETIIRGCSYSGKSGRYWTNDGSYNDLRTPMMPEVRGYTTNTDTAYAKDISRGDFTIEGCTFEIGFEDNPTVIRSPLTIGSNTIPMESVTITDCDIRYDGSHSADLIYIKQGWQLGHTLPVHIENVRYANSISGALAPITASMVTLDDSHHTVTGDVSGLS